MSFEEGNEMGFGASICFGQVEKTVPKETYRYGKFAEVEAAEGRRAAIQAAAEAAATAVGGVCYHSNTAVPTEHFCREVSVGGAPAQPFIQVRGVCFVITEDGGMAFPWEGEAPVEFRWASPPVADTGDNW